MRPAWRQSMRLASILLALLLGACAQVPSSPRAPDVEFDLTGRLAARYGDESFSGNLAWRHAPSADEMLISTPLGQGVARIAREAGTVSLTTAEQREYRAADAESLTQQILGFRLPLAGLADWVRARPSPGAPAEIERDTEGRPSRLRQSGWQIEYQAYEEGLPSRLRLSYPGLELRLAISRWN